MKLRGTNPGEWKETIEGLYFNERIGVSVADWSNGLWSASHTIFGASAGEISIFVTAQGKSPEEAWENLLAKLNSINGESK